MDRVENSATPKPTLFRATEPGKLPNTSTGISITSLAATVRALAGIYSPQPPGCRKEDSSCKNRPFLGPANLHSSVTFLTVIDEHFLQDNVGVREYPHPTLVTPTFNDQHPQFLPGEKSNSVYFTY
jgi:hypothetical protein